MGRTPSIFVIKKKCVGVCIINTNNNTITYPNGLCKKVNQWEICHEQDIYIIQTKRGTLL